MKIREAFENDIPEIVSVLKASLGEDQLELSEKVWRYKHIDNPFGKSIVLLAVEEDEIIGVRAFMRWKWQAGDKEYSTLRAVDTATHPDHQGKGIFKNLTLAAVDLAKSQGDHFIFNTPNEKSRPGYLKMGWEQIGKIFIGLKPTLSFLKFNDKIAHYQIEKYISSNDLDNLCEKWNDSLENKSGLFTPKTAEMLHWRYENNPLQAYEVQVGESYYLAGYIKNRGKLKEFRIAECIYDDKILNNKQLKEIIHKFISKFSSHAVSFAPKLAKLKGKKGNIGPVLTFNALNLEAEEIKDFSKINNWRNSLGDLELF